jgi:WD40 repeat protein
MTTGDSAATLLGHEDWVSSAAIDRDGGRIVTASDDGTARVWRFPVERPVATTPVHGSYFGGDLSRDGRLIVVHDPRRSEARIIDVRTGRTVSIVDRGRALEAQFGPGGYVLTAAPDHVAAFDAATGDPIRAAINRGMPSPPVVSADGRKVVAVTNKGLREWNVEDGVLGPVLPKSASPWNYVLSADGRYAAAHASAGKVRVWDVAAGELIGEVKHAKSNAGGLAVSADGRTVVVAEGPRARAFAVDDGEPLFFARSHRAVDTISFSNDGKLLLTAGGENTARVWDAATGDKLAALRGHAGTIMAAKFSPDNRLVITGSADGTARIWAARSGELLDEVNQDAEDPVRSVTFTADSRRFLAASSTTAAAYDCVACGSTDDLLRLAHARSADKAEP